VITVGIAARLTTV